ncbi:MAG TPA: choice-of-anchor Q domain-containing protein [Blastocatellia bacterium]|nr:choice-of-anchor Q domain-containing protein [Blastocatellia bacterium]
MKRAETTQTHSSNIASRWSKLGREWRRGRRALGVMLLVWAMTLAPLPWPVTPVMAATITVNTTMDENDTTPNATCSLREAVIAANTDQDRGGCKRDGMGSDDTIVLQSGQTYTLQLDVGTADSDAIGTNMIDDLDISSAGTLTIQVQGGGVATIQRTGTCSLDGSLGTGEFRIFEVLTGGNLTLQNVTVTSGCADGSGTDADGGGILNLGTLTIQSSTISGNRASSGGGIFNNGTLTIQSSTISGNSAGSGGGISNNGTLTITSSTISGNTASLGGGIRNAGTVTITNSTISGNSALGDGGGIVNFLTMNASFVTIANNSTSSGRGGGISTSTGPNTETKIKNSIVGKNTSGGDCSGSITGMGNNYDSDDTCFGSSGDAIFLGPLQNNGGPTATHALLSGDPLDGAADCTDLNNTSVTADQRGSSRPKGGQCDAGAYEVQNPKMLSISINGNGTVTSNPGDINCMTGNMGTCMETYDQNTPVELTATPDSSSVFAGWGGNCSNGDEMTQVTMDADKMCTATFVQKGTIVIQKTAIGGNGTFNFTRNDNSFSIMTSDGSGSQSFGLAPGTYTFTESTLPTGWAFQDLVCQLTTGTNSETEINLTTRMATIMLAAGETVICTFTNIKLGSITIIKEAVPDDRQDFSFTWSGDIGTFLLDDDNDATLPNQRTFSNLMPGSYMVSEDSVSGWRLTDLVCTDPGGGTKVNLSQRTATIDLAAGETVTCTFTNTRLGVSLFTLQQGTKCLTLDLLAGSYVFKTDRGTFRGAIEFTQTPNVIRFRIRFRSVRGASPALSGLINLGARAGSATLAQGFRFWITLIDRNIDDNGLCPP